MSIFPLYGIWDDNPRAVLVDSLFTGGSANKYYASGGFINVLAELLLLSNFNGVRTMGLGGEGGDPRAVSYTIGSDR